MIGAMAGLAPLGSASDARHLYDAVNHRRHLNTGKRLTRRRSDAGHRRCLRLGRNNDHR